MSKEVNWLGNTWTVEVYERESVDSPFEILPAIKLKVDFQKAESHALSLAQIA